MNIFKHFGITRDKTSKNEALSGTTQSLIKLSVAPKPVVLSPELPRGKGIIAPTRTSPVVPLPSVRPEAKPINPPNKQIPIITPGWGGPVGWGGTVARPAIPIPRVPNRISGLTTLNTDNRGLLSKTFNPTPAEAQIRREGLVGGIKALAPSSVGLVVGTRDKAWGIGIGVPPASVSQKLAERRMEVTSFTKPVEAGRLMAFKASRYPNDAVGSAGFLESLRK